MNRLALFAIFSLICFQAYAAVQGPVYMIRESRFQALIDRMNQVQFSDSKSNILNNSMLTYCFFSNQTASILGTFRIDGDKLFALETIKNNIIDPVNKQKIIDVFNRSDDKQRATDILINITNATACKTVPNPNSPVIPWSIPYTNKWNQDNLTDLIKVVHQVPISTGKIKVAEVAIMSRTEILTPHQTMQLFDAYPTYKDILTLKEAINDRLTGITCDQMITLLMRFSFEGQRSEIINNMQCASKNIASSFDNDLIVLADMIQMSLSGSSCDKLSPIAERFAFDDQKLAILEAFTTSIVDLENKYTILEAFDLKSSKEKAKKIIDTFKPNSYLFGAPSGKVVFILDVSGSMSTTFKINSTTTFSRLDFVRREFTKIVNSFNESIAFNVFSFADNVVLMNTSLVNATQANIKMAVDFAYRYGASGGTNTYGALQKAFNITGVETIYFLSDGMPSTGTKVDPNAIVADVRLWNSKGQVKINSIGLLMGTTSGENKTVARNFMKTLSDITGGVYRILESDN